MLEYSYFGEKLSTPLYLMTAILIRPHEFLCLKFGKNTHMGDQNLKFKGNVSGDFTVVENQLFIQTMYQVDIQDVMFC